MSVKWLAGRRVVLRTGLGCIGLLVGFAVVEGAASLFLLASDVLGNIEHERSTPDYVSYDSELGWTNIPGIALPDYWGPGAGITTNERGFRGAKSTSPVPPDGLKRIVCSGDSFTFGVEVGDADTWVSRLAFHRPSVDVVNMGVGGYGVGQAYLRFLRDAADLSHSVHLFCVISRDFIRMTKPVFQASYKPVVVKVFGVYPVIGFW